MDAPLRLWPVPCFLGGISVGDGERLEIGAVRDD
jgi:hypothetical protein